ncbi:pilus assembly protein [Nocardioidaceae bacterium]|nr:pilus assembly protein [Nocardioidaceae bacterium]
MRGTWAGRRTDQTGAAAVEFALIVPLLLLLVLGMIQYGFYFWSLQGGASAAREAARRASVGQPTSCVAFANAVSANLDGLTSGDATISRTFSTVPPQPGSNVVVRVAFDSHDLNIPVVPFIDGGRITQRASARVDYVPDSTIGNC